MKKTIYITLEGGDGSGKSTLVQKLVDHYKSLNKSVLLTKEFGSTLNPFCSGLRDFALNSAYEVDEIAGQIVFGAIIKQHQEKVIKPAIVSEAYDVIISDRGPYSNYCYGPAHGIDKKFINKFFNLVYDGAIKPTISIFLNTPKELAEKRRSKREAEKFVKGGVDRVEAKGTEFQDKVIKNFIKMAKKDPNLKILNIKESMNPDDVLAESLKIIKSVSN